VTEERWLPVVGFEGFYEVSDAGRMRSLSRTVKTCHGGTRQHLGRILKLTASAKGHLYVGLSRDGVVTLYFVHRAALEAFCGPCPPEMEGCHGDGNPANNNLSNLRWDTRSNNHLDAVRHGTHSRTKRSHCPRGHALVEPNLTAQSISTGRRKCLACHRATGLRLGYARAAWRIELPDLQAFSDAFHQEILGRGSAALDEMKAAWRRVRPNHCPHGHALLGSNLCPSKLKKGHRGCRSCARARVRVFKRPELDFKTLADQYYVRFEPKVAPS
jgi:hypothetical protein